MEHPYMEHPGMEHPYDIKHELRNTVPIAGRGHQADEAHAVEDRAGERRDGVAMSDAIAVFLYQVAP